MALSIYLATRRKLTLRGVKNTCDGNPILIDKDLFLLFVTLERALRSKSFDAVQAAVQAIESYATSIGKRYLVLFAYWYIHFSDGTPKMTTIDNGLEGDGMRITMEYRRAVTDEEIAIAAWAKVKFSRYGDSFFRVLYSHQL
ncbi:MAG: hypothetical protein EOS78_24960 [Mesorhizobium sp.]|uniref:hypothetical protein n=1 Tax=unclassified Mesorhizobium TaxID=325217 RepID=UPI000F75829C|nr:MULTISPECIES: hypothetical protein [unclassified Mesorhizobium]AZO57265.1 hypothetical protein EJ077_30540 [Mesorhizobium sp. M8A.F.Ca.ET.057.01.1.1]RWE32028.1 MAG: hypothetical protein EOS78_24960 [Mesorhizobium sp.]RWE47881.1 MAG: hypothetical protein EOS80_07280 [Mesorhizobium sp.]TJX60989.1 MAG: hypothetical protein E5W21_12835 [Mesorhizobium sp.]